MIFLHPKGEELSSVSFEYCGERETWPKVSNVTQEATSLQEEQSGDFLPEKGHQLCEPI